MILVTDPQAAPPVRYALEKVRLALREKGISTQEGESSGSNRGAIWLVAGRTDGGGAAAGWLDSARIAPPRATESLLIRRLNQDGRRIVLVAGADDRGLMYGLLDMAARIKWSQSPEDPFTEVRDTRQEPAVADRALSIYTMHRKHFERRFFDEKYWERYLDTLAENRFNSFVLIFALSLSF